MFANLLRPETCPSRNFRSLGAIVLFGWLASPGYAIEVVAIEEYWELSIGEPDVESSSPQVSMVMSPTGDVEGDYFVVTLNHRNVPEYQAGGVQVQRWHGEEAAGTAESSETETLSENNEKVTWVQRLELHEGELVFEVVEGTSESWGSFGSGELRLTLPWQAANLNAYRPSVSIEQSGVGFAGNRVKSLVLRKLRWIDSTGQAHELNAPIDVDADLDP